MAITVTIQPDSSQGIDTYISQAAATTNYGTATTMTIGRVATSNFLRALIRFDLNLFIPRKAILIEPCLLQLYITEAEAGGTQYPYQGIIGIKNEWVENEATWNIRKTGINWLTAGIFVNTDDILGYYGENADRTGLMASYKAGASPINAVGWITFQVFASYLENMRQGKNYGFCIYAIHGTDGENWSCASSDNATVANRPKLTITYEPYHKIFPISAGLGQVR